MLRLQSKYLVKFADLIFRYNKYSHSLYHNNIVTKSKRKDQ